MTELKPFLEDMLSMSTGVDGRTLQIHFCRPVTAEDRKALMDAHNFAATRPAPAATDTGLETKGWEVTRYDNDGRWLETSLHIVEPSITGTEPTDTEELVHRVTAEAIIANVEAEKAKAIREAGEYFAKTCMMAEEICNLKEASSQAVELLAAERAEKETALMLYKSASRALEAKKEKVRSLEADNAAQHTSIVELEAERAGLEGDIANLEKQIAPLEADNAAKDARIKTETELRKDHQERNIELEAKLVVAEKALEPFADHANDQAVDDTGWRDKETVKIVVSIGDLRKARAVLGGKPSC